MKKYSSRFWKRVLGENELVEKGICVVNVFGIVDKYPQYIYQLTLIPKKLWVLVITYYHNVDFDKRSYRIVAKNSLHLNTTTCTVDSVNEVRRYLKDGLLNSRDPKKLRELLKNYYPDHHTQQYRISLKLINTVLSDLDFLYSDFYQGEFRFWLRGIKLIVDDKQCNIVVEQLMGNRILATYAGNIYGLNILKSYYFG